MNTTRADYVFFSKGGKAQVGVLNCRVRRTGIIVDSVNLRTAQRIACYRPPYCEE